MNNSSNIFWIIAAWCTLFLLEYSYQAKTKGSPTQLDRSFRTSLRNMVSAIIVCLPLILFFNGWRQLIPGLVPNSRMQIFALCFLLLITAMIALTTAIKKSKLISNKAEISTAQFATYLVSRVVFLIVYECFFRGLMLYFFIQAFGVAVAVVANIFLYTLIHSLKERAEMLACIPFGLALCVMTIWCRSLLPAIILHLALALVHETYLQFSPNQHPKLVNI